MIYQEAKLGLQLNELPNFNAVSVGFAENPELCSMISTKSFTSGILTVDCLRLYIWHAKLYSIKSRLDFMPL